VRFAPGGFYQFLEEINRSKKFSGLRRCGTGPNAAA